MHVAEVICVSPSAITLSESRTLRNDSDDSRGRVLFPLLPGSHLPRMVSYLFLSLRMSRASFTCLSNCSEFSTTPRSK